MVDLWWETRNYFEAGGWIMIPLVVVSIWLWTLIVVKLYDLALVRSETKILKKMDVQQVSDTHYLSRERLSGWPGKIFDRFTAWRMNRPDTDRRLLSGLLIGQTSRLDRHVDTILVLATVSPLIGLLGTVSGMITTFDVISDFGTGNAKGLAGGISEALITTQGGLMAALPGLFMGNFIRRRVERAKHEMERFCLMLLNTPPGSAGMRKG